MVQSLYMLVLGAGVGLSMQVLTIAVQNTVEYANLGTATSGVTFFRTLGSSFGTAVFGTIYGNRLKPVRCTPSSCGRFRSPRWDSSWRCSSSR